MPSRVVECNDLGRHARAWDDAVAAMPLPSPFLRSWWLTAIADSSTVFLIVEDSSGTFLGGLPLTRKSLPLLDIYLFLGSRTPLCPDHLDVVAAPDDLRTVTEALTAWATRRGNRIFVLDGVAAHSQIAQWLPHARTSPLDSAPYQLLPATAADYLAARPRSFRKTVRRARNRFADATIRTATADDLQRTLDAFAAMHRDRGDRGELLAHLPTLRRALAAGVHAGEVWVDELVERDEVIAVSIAFSTAGRVSLYQTARTATADNGSTILNLAAVDRAIAAGATEVDLLRGAEPYKRHYAEHDRALLRILGAHGRAAVVALAGLERVRRISRGLRAWRAGSGS